MKSHTGKKTYLVPTGAVCIASAVTWFVFAIVDFSRSFANAFAFLAASSAVSASSNAVLAVLATGVGVCVRVRFDGEVLALVAVLRFCFGGMV